MKYDDDIYSNENDSDFWDDELELDLDDHQDRQRETSRPAYSEESTYTPYSGGYDDSGSDSHDHYGYDNSYGHDSSSEDPDHDYYSDPEPASPTVRPRKPEIPEEKEDAADNDEDDDDDHDYYSETETEPKPRPRRPKTPKLDPEDPDYWISEDDSPLSGLVTGPGKKWIWKLAAAMALIFGLMFAWIWFLRPHTDSAVKYGYIKSMERRGALIKTFEGTMIPYKELGDPDPLYFREMAFSVEGDSLAAVMKRMMLGCVPVRVEYELYHAPLPWKGEEKMIVIKADTADPRKILPPEYRGKY